MLDSNAFTVTLTAKRKHEILSLCQASLDSSCQKIKDLASLIGCLIAVLPGVKNVLFLPSARAL